jgi:hypothetical protein
VTTIPTFLVIGAARCGTTGLVEGLRSHPRVFVTDPKEPHYFALHRIGARFTAPGDEHTINRVAVTDRTAYLALYPQDHDFLALGDASVSTLYYHQDAIPEILAMNPAMRLVIMLREPVDRAYSSHQYMTARGLEPVADFLEAVALEPQRIAEGWHHIWHYTAQGRYADQVAAYLEAFPADQVGVFFYDDLNRDYEATVSRILRFLGVPPAPGEAAGVPRVNVSGQPRFAAAHRMIAWATGHARLRQFVKDHTSYRLRERVRRGILRQDTVGEQARAALEPVFADDLRRLSALLEGRLDTPPPAWLTEAGR